ncbi:MAG: hypothetical protein VX815_12195 [Gemmatimonadota bacterium]|nr:hypothetical protein [Gemmatimonadota bacterium]
MEQALLVQRHHRDARDELGHRRDSEDDVVRHGSRFVDIHHPLAAQAHQLAATGHGRNHTRDPGLVDIRLEERIDSCEPIGRDADRVGAMERSLELGGTPVRDADPRAYLDATVPYRRTYTFRAQ